MNVKNSAFLKELIFISIFFNTIFVFAQNKPGNTSLDVELWLKADQISQTNGTNVTTWTDQSGNNRSFSQYLTHAIPTFSFSGMNFNPTVQFGSANNTKLVGPVNINDITKEYYIYTVSYNRSTNYSTLLSFNQERNNSYGWSSTVTTPWIYIGGNRFPTNGIGKPFNISTVFNPNRAASSNPLITTYQYLNGIPNNLNAARQAETSTTNRMTLGTSDLGTYWNFTGDISEIIVLSRPKSIGLGTPYIDDIQKVNSYLSLKYGISLDPISQPEYINSVGNSIWNSRTASEYSNFVFGIGRDDTSALLQKQSTNFENNDFTFFLGETLSDTNKNNNGSISNDLSFLLVGSNNALGTISYIKTPVDNFQEGVISSQINQRYKRTLKAAKTGTGIGNVNIKLANQFIHTSHVIVSDTDEFITGTTRIYPVLDNIARNVEIRDGDYISFISNLNAPGGTNLTTELWLKADNLNLNENTNVTTWGDLSGYGRNFSQYLTQTVPTFNSLGMNYNPSVTFGNAANTKLVGPNNFMSTDKEYYIYYVSQSTSTAEQTVLSFNQNYNPMVGWRSSAPFIYVGGRSVATNGIGKLYSINSVFLPNEANTNDIKNHLYVNGVDNIFNASALSINNSRSMIIGTYDLGTSSPFYGNLSELIILSAPKGNGTPDLNDLKKVNSYLSLKYGITLNPTAQAIYYNSAGDEIWNSTTNSDYSNHIFGIGRDDLTGYNQKQGTNYENSVFSIFIGDTFHDTNNANTTNIANDKSFLILGSNNQNGTVNYIEAEGYTFPNNTTITSDEELKQRYNRTLKVSKTGFENNVTFKLKLTGLYSLSPYVLISSDPQFPGNNTRAYKVTNGITANMIVNDDDYISFISPNLSPGGTTLDTELWLRADFISANDGQNITTWFDVTNNSRNFSQYLTHTVPTYNTVGMNYNPTVQFGSANNTKLVGPVNINDNTKEYYIYTVSYNKSTDFSTLLSFNQERNNSYGWSSTVTTPWTYIGGNRFPTNGIGKPFNISVVFNPNRAASSDPLITTYQYLNGIPNNLNAARQAETSTTNRMTLGTSDLGTAWNFTGDISEIIVLSAPKGSGTPNLNDIQKVNSYLSLKYGITLDPTAQPNYYNSLGDVIWNGDNNSGYQQNIFAIGRDDLTGYYQKQGTNYDNSSVTLFLGELANKNDENNATISTNRNFIVLGSNGDNTVIDYTPPSNFNSNGKTAHQRFARTLKVQKTGNFDDNELNIKLSNELYHSSYVIISSDATFSTNTRFYPVINGIANNIIINNADYISFIAEDNTPAGLTGLKRELWVIGDKISSASIEQDPEDIFDTDIISWDNQADNSMNFINTDTAPFYPKKINNSMNFHSAADFYYIDTISTNPYVSITKAENQSRKLISEKDFTIDANRSYYTIYISRIDTENITNTINNEKSVLTLNSTNNFGWIGNTNTHPWIRVNNTSSTNAFTAETRTYGITVNMLANNDNNTQRYLSLNGIQNTSIIGSSTMSTTETKAIIGNGTNNAYNFFGEVLEILVLSKEGKGQLLTTDELNKINSYYAIKYGITLNTVQKQYLLSNGNIIYDTDDTAYAAYNKDIFGIARDDKSELNQKQSTSTDNPILTIYQGSLTETNTENTSNLLNNNEALILGATGDIGTTSSYRYPPETIFKNYIFRTITDPETEVTIGEKTSSIFNYHYKAKVTTSNNTINVNLASSIGQWILVSDNPSFLPEETDIYQINNGIAQNVTIKNGDYIGFAFYLQAPGGVTPGLRMWLNAAEQNTISTNEQGQVLTWTDYSGFGTIYKRRPENKSSALYIASDQRTNYHPTLEFKSATDYLITDHGPMLTANPEKTTFYTVVNHDFARDRSYFLGYGSHVPGGAVSRQPVFGVFKSNNGGYARIRSSGARNSVAELFKIGSTMIAGYHWHIGTDIMFEFDSQTQTISNTGNKSSVMNGKGMLGAGSLTDSYLFGTLPEVIAYDRILEEEEKDKVNSYLALKYGLTLRKNVYPNNSATPTSTANFNYKFSGNNNGSVWDGTTAPLNKYHNNVISIVRDDESQLYNKQSRSTNTGDNIHIGIKNPAIDTETLNTLNVNRNTLGVNANLGKITQNLSALTIGNNGKEFTTSVISDDVCGEIDKRVGNRVWITHKTSNFNQEIILKATDSQGFPFIGSNYKVYLLIADKEEKLITSNGEAVNNWDQIIPMEYIDGGHVINYNFTNENTYFTFGAKQVNACESCTFEGNKKIQFDKSTWPTRGEKGPVDFDLGNNFNINITVEDNNPSGQGLNNRYPRYSSRKSLRERRKGTDEIKTTIKFLDDYQEATAAATNFTLYDIDRAGYKVDDVQVIGLCNGNPVYPTISYMYRRPERSRYSILQNSEAKAKTPGIRYSGGSGYTNARGMAYVDFETPVEEIQIIYKTPTTRTNRNNTQEIGIGEINFYCIAPLPAPNEDGLIFTKQAPSEALLCDLVEYTFRIINTNCDPKAIEFTDLLPPGMTWVEDSFTVIDPTLVIDPDNPPVMYDNIEITTENNQQRITVTGLNAPGGGTTYTLKASAIFKQDALAGTYNNQGIISYNNHTLFSTDRLTGNPLSTTVATASSNRPKLVEISEFSINKTCFNANQPITATLKIYNPNEYPIENMVLDIGYDSESVEYINYSIDTPINSNNVIVDQETEDGETIYGGFVTFDGFTLPPGLSTITLSFKTVEDLEFIDPITLKPYDLLFSYELVSDNADPCLANTTLFTSGEKELSYCTYCTQPPVGGTKLDSDTGISTLKSKFPNWPSEVPNGFLVLESSKKGMVITRTKPEDIATPVKGMIIYNTVSKCISIYNGSQWKCIERACNE